MGEVVHLAAARPRGSEWLEVFLGVVKGTQQARWYVEWCTRDGTSIVADAGAKQDALAAAHEWGLPVIVHDLRESIH